MIAFAGNLALTPMVYAAPGAAAATTAELGGEAVLAYKGGKMAPELIALAADKTLVKRRAKALYAFVLLRLAHLFVKSPGRPPSDADTAQAMAPLVHESLLDVALDIGEFTAATVIAKATEAMLLKRYPATTLPSKLLTKVKSYGPIFTLWAVTNGIQQQVKEGKWSDGFRWELVPDLARKVGHELLTLVAVTLALKLVGYPFALLGKLANEKLLERFATLKIVTSAVGVWASRVLTFANAAGWIVLALTIFYPMAQKAYAAEEVRQMRHLVGQQVRYRTQLVDLLLSAQGDRVAPMLAAPDRAILANVYMSDKNPFAPSKFELLVQLGDANNQFVEEKLKEMKTLLLENRRDRDKDARAIAKRQKRIEQLKGEIRSIFGDGKASFFDLDGLQTIGEAKTLQVESGLLESVSREAGNMVTLSPAFDEMIARTERLVQKNQEAQRPTFVGVANGEEKKARDAEWDRIVQEKVDNVRGLVEQEAVGLKSYCRDRLAQIQKLTTQFPTEGEAAAEAAIGEATFEAVGEMGGAGGARSPDGAAGFGGLEGR